MRTVDLRQAESELERLVDDALRGEQIVLTRDGHPVARLVAVAPARAARTLGTAAGQVRIAEDFDAPLEGFEGTQHGAADESAGAGDLFLASTSAEAPR